MEPEDSIHLLLHADRFLHDYTDTCLLQLPVVKHFLVKFCVKIIEIFGIEFFLCHFYGFAKTVKVDNFPLAEKF